MSKADLIDRKTVIDALMEHFKRNTTTAIRAKLTVEGVPSAQPELVAQGAYVRGFEQGRTQGMLDTKLQPTCNQLATDCISRRAAIDAVYKCTEIFINNLPVMVDKADVYKALAELSSAQPEIIRCKDCAKRKYCRTSTIWAVSPSDDWYCADAERRNDG